MNAHPWSDPLIDSNRAARLLSLFEPIEPDESVWSEIERAISRDRPRWIRRPRRPAGPFVAALVAAAAFVVGVSTAAVVSGSDSSDFDTLAAAIAADASSVTHSLSDPGSGVALATMVVAEDGTAIFSSAGLPALGSDRTYQLWSVIDGAVISAGLLGPDPTAIALRIESDPELLAVTVEQTGGVVVSEQLPVAVWATETPHESATGTA